MSTRLLLTVSEIASLEAALDAIRARVRRARRFTTKSASPTGIKANVALHEAERIAVAALSVVRGEP